MENINGLNLMVDKYDTLKIGDNNKKVLGGLGYKKLVFMDLEFLSVLEDKDKFFSWEIPFSELSYFVYDIEKTRVVKNLTSYVAIPEEEPISYGSYVTLLNGCRSFLSAVTKKDTLVIFFGTNDLTAMHIASRLVSKNYGNVNFDYIDISKLSIYLNSDGNSLESLASLYMDMDIGKHNSSSDAVTTFLLYMSLTESGKEHEGILYTKEGVLLDTIIPTRIRKYNGGEYNKKLKCKKELDKYINNRNGVVKKSKQFEKLSVKNNSLLSAVSRKNVQKKHYYLKRLGELLQYLNNTRKYNGFSKINMILLAQSALQYTLSNNIDLSDKDIEENVIQVVLDYITSSDIHRVMRKNGVEFLITHLTYKEVRGDIPMTEKTSDKDNASKSDILQEEYTELVTKGEDIFSGVERISNADNIIDEPDDLVLVDKEVGKLIQDSDADETQYPYYLTPNNSVTPSSKKGEGKSLMLPYTSEVSEDSTKKGCNEMVNGYTYEELQEQIANLMKENTSLKDLNSVVTQTKSKKEQEYEKALHTKDLEIRELTVRLNNSQSTLGNTKKELKEVTAKLDNFTDRMFNILVNK